MNPLRFRVWSDYLCPWCYNASVRLRALEREYEGRIALEWRSYLLRPRPGARTAEKLERFRAYTRSWERPAAEPDSGNFRVWSGDSGPPTHSLPAHLVAKAAARIGHDAFGRMHDRLLRAYFCENQDISDSEILRTLWCELDLPEDGFEASADASIRDAVLDEYNECFEIGVTGVPAVQLVGNPAVIVGAHPAELYRRWIERMLAKSEVGATP